MNAQIYSILANKVGAYHRCSETGNTEWEEKHLASIREIVAEYAPSGSGFDNGTSLIIDDSTENLLVFQTAFHHMDENGMYDGWTEHTVYVRPSLAHDYKLSIGGRDRNQIKEYIADTFATFLSLNPETVAA